MKYPVVSKNFKLALSEKNMTQQELSNISGIGKSSISHYCNGTHCPDNLRSIKLASILGVNPLWLMGLSNNKEPIPSKTLSELDSLFANVSPEVQDSVMTILKASQLTPVRQD